MGEGVLNELISSVKFLTDRGMYRAASALLAMVLELRGRVADALEIKSLVVRGEGLDASRIEELIAELGVGKGEVVGVSAPSHDYITPFLVVLAAFLIVLTVLDVVPAKASLATLPTAAIALVLAFDRVFRFRGKG